MSVPEGCDVDCKYQHSTDTYVEQINESIGGNISGFITHRLSELASSYFTPHGTIPFGSVSVRDGVMNWVQNERSLGGLAALIQIEGFAFKLIIWVIHYGGIVLGIAGMWLSRRSWQMTLPLIGFIVYTTLIHFVLLALPRYIFPVEVPLLILASVTILSIYQRLFTSKPPESIEA